jgi:predicted Fe-Mo cluster-binding NifX family protein
MIIVITSKGNSPDSKLDSHFGRCSHFVFYDTLTNSMEFFPNPFKDIKEEAGLQAANLLATRNTGKIVTGELGIKVKPLLDRLKIQLIIFKNKEKSIQDIINMLNH